jgi:hypothetical protein
MSGNHPKVSIQQAKYIVLKLLKFLHTALLSISQINSPVVTDGPKEVLTLVVTLAVLLL